MTARTRKATGTSGFRVCILGSSFNDSFLAREVGLPDPTFIPAGHGEEVGNRRAFAVSSVNEMSTMARELAQRLSGTDEVLLLWHPGSELLVLSVRNRETGEGFHLDVAAGSAIDAFY